MTRSSPPSEPLDEGVRVGVAAHDLAPVGTIYSDKAGRIVRANARARELGLVRLCHDGEELACDGLLRADGQPLVPAEHPTERVRREGLEAVADRIGVRRDDLPTEWLRVMAARLPDAGVVTTCLDITASVQAEADLHHSLDQLDAFFNASLDLLAILNSDGHAIRLNPSWNQCLGYERGSVDYARVLDLVHPADMETTLGALARLRTPDEVVGFVNRIRHHDGGYRSFEWRAAARDDLIYATARDITEKERAEAALLRSEQRYRVLFEQAAAGVAEVDPDNGRFIQVNRRFCEIVGYTPAELEQKTFASLSHPDGLELDIVAARRIARGELEEYRREKRYLHKNGDVVWVDLHVRAIKDRVGRATRNVTVIQDVTQRVDAEERLRKALADALQANQRLKFQSSRMPLAYIAWDRDFRATEWNEAAERIFGWPASEAIGRHAYELIIPRDVSTTLEPKWQSLLAGDQAGNHNINENCTRDGRRITCEWFNAPLVDDGGTVIGALSMAHDITERQRLEDLLRQSQRLESLAGFASGVAHDANSILHTIAQLANSLYEGSPNPEIHRRSADAILKICAKGRTLVRGLLDFGGREVEEAVQADVNALLQEQLHLLGTTIPENVHLDTSLDPDLPKPELDVPSVGAAFMHLLLNAIEAMRHGGTLTLRTRMRGRNELVVRIEDTGLGMPRQVLDHAMEPFFTTKPGHTGLGLATVYGTVKAHHGRMEIQSEFGKGTQVEVVLPVNATLSAAVLLELEEAPRPPRGIRILVADDDDLVLATLSAQLRRLGHEVAHASNGQEALDKLREGLAADLVLLDITMPVLDGVETLPRLRELRPDLPVILETGGAGDSAQKLANTYRDVSILLRPYTMSELKATLAPWVERARK